MATLRIERSSEYINKLRNYTIILDGKKVGKIADGESKELLIDPGVHTLRFGIDWTSSREETFVVDQGDQATFRVSGFKGAKWMMPVGLAIIALGIVFDWTLGFVPVFYLPGVIFAVLTYYLTIGRKRYLHIEQLNTNVTAPAHANT